MPGLLARRVAARTNKLSLTVQQPECNAAARNPFLDAFDVKEVLGSGSMAAVYRVRCQADQIEFAGKRVRSVDDELIQFTREEHRLLTSLQHPAIVQGFDLFEAPGETWLCMELCEGGCVQTHVEKKGAFTQHAGKALFLQLLQGIDHLHSKRIVHRDIKPQNLMLTRDAKQLKIGDFNSARKLCSDGRHGGTMLSQRCTPRYCAPEMATGLDWNERVDVWSAGLSAFFMLRARLPAFRAQTDVRPILDWGAEPQHALSVPVEQCLTVDGKRRPSAMEVLQHPALAVAEPLRSRSLTQPRRRTDRRRGSSR